MIDLHKTADVTSSLGTIISSTVGAAGVAYGVYHRIQRWREHRRDKGIRARLALAEAKLAVLQTQQGSK